MAKRNVTVALDEDVARWARIAAAERDTSLSQMIADLLRERMAEEDDYDAAMKDYLSRKPRPLRRSGRYPTRDEIHDRHRVR